MKIAILTSGILPVPAVLGGAVENLIDFYLEYNERHQLHDITIYIIPYFYCLLKEHLQIPMLITYEKAALGGQKNLPL